MKLSRRGCLNLLAASGASAAIAGVTWPKDAISASLDRALGYLMESRDRDGVWRSSLNPLMGGGHALTAYLCSLIGERVPESLDWLEREILDSGALGYRDPDLLEYPVYSNSLALRAMARYRSNSDAADVLGRYLLEQQLTEERGFDRSHPAYGGWSFGAILPKGKCGHVDLPHTRFALEALREWGKAERTVFVKAQRHLDVLQKHPSTFSLQPKEKGVFRMKEDGGFYLSAVVPGANKAGWEGGLLKSYPSATCEGGLALIAIEDTGDRLGWAKDFLRDHLELKRPVVVSGPKGPWDSAMHYYYLAQRARMLGREDGAGLACLLQEQRGDGSWKSESPLLSENDPLVATAHCVEALLAYRTGVS